MHDYNETICAEVDFITADAIAAMAYGLGMCHYSKQLETDLLDRFGKLATYELDTLIDACDGINDARLCRSDECPQYCWARSGFMKGVRIAWLSEKKVQQAACQATQADVPF